MSIIPVNTAIGAEVSIQTFGAIGVGILTLLVFLICSEHLFLMPALSLVYKAGYTLVDLQMVEEVYLNCKAVH